MLIGKGSHGSVYKAVSHGGRRVAINKPSIGVELNQEADTEMEILVGDAFRWVDGLLLSDGNGAVVIWLLLACLFICLFIRCCIVMSYFLVFVVSDPGSHLFCDFVGSLFRFCCFCLDQCCSDPKSFRILLLVQWVWEENLASVDSRRPWLSAECILYILSCPLDFVLRFSYRTSFRQIPPRSMVLGPFRSPFVPVLCLLALVGSVSISARLSCLVFAIFLYRQFII